MAMQNDTSALQGQKYELKAKLSDSKLRSLVEYYINSQKIPRSDKVKALIDDESIEKTTQSESVLQALEAKLLSRNLEKILRNDYLITVM